VEVVGGSTRVAVGGASRRDNLRGAGGKQTLVSGRRRSRRDGGRQRRDAFIFFFVLSRSDVAAAHHNPDLGRRSRGIQSLLRAAVGVGRRSLVGGVVDPRRAQSSRAPLARAVRGVCVICCFSGGARRVLARAQCLSLRLSSFSTSRDKSRAPVCRQSAIESDCVRALQRRVAGGVVGVVRMALSSSSGLPPRMKKKTKNKSQEPTPVGGSRHGACLTTVSIPRCPALVLSASLALSTSAS
jgi:hypothetical protein